MSGDTTKYLAWCHEHRDEHQAAHDEIVKKYAGILKLHRNYVEYPFGWSVIVESTLGWISRWKPPADFSVVQIKDKFGALRIYTRGASRGTEKIIAQAESLSNWHCIACGYLVGIARSELTYDPLEDLPPKVSKGGWLFGAMCVKCREKFDLQEGIQ